MKSCPVCNTPWEASERIYEHFRKNGYSEKQAAEVALLYGDSSETPRYFGINHHGVEYPCTHRHHYDGVSEWRCKCGVRIGRWSGRVLKDNETEPPYGEQK